ncbi:glutaredoxin [candidate division TA06 bacterium DG_24]|jgi:glutaredoxin-like protein NrdH|uniref:Glutaredoxin n=3 Tax=Bacteria division TA06 TaxID=1156500 RepID=A0A0S8JK20_UNCT6|nr:MAG: glutaredoxin [candidate division TA06 bacterium DG_24]KPK70233.1 MAG: glutaredoxin [candidate division TA06 bacterium SM23_40]KPL09962.1 MAG: glutaredoxin [candidate division TA06 bacterium SM1_40]
MKATHVKGKDRGHIFLFALSTCGWCRKTKRLLQNLGVAYEYIDVDLLKGKEKTEAEKEMRRWSPRTSFPTLVINDEKSVVGFDEARIREAIGI